MSAFDPAGFDAGSFAAEAADAPGEGEEQILVGTPVKPQRTYGRPLRLDKHGNIVKGDDAFEDDAVEVPAVIPQFEPLPSLAKAQADLAQVSAALEQAIQARAEAQARNERVAAVNALTAQVEAAQQALERARQAEARARDEEEFWLMAA